MTDFRTTADLYADEIRAARIAIRRLYALGSLTISKRMAARLDRCIAQGDDVGIENACADALALAVARQNAIIDDASAAADGASLVVAA